MQSNFTLYHEALKDLLKQVFSGDVVMEEVDTAFRYAIEQTNNDLKLPFISFYPDNTITLDRKNNAMPSYTEGIPFMNPIVTYNEDGSVKGTNNRLAKNTQFLYIIIGYQLDVWGTTRLEAEQVMQELLFWLHQNQQVSIKYQGVDLSFSFNLGTDIVDNSDLVSYTNTGKLYRFTYNIEMHSTLMRSENYFTVLHPNVEVTNFKEEE